MKVNSFNLRKGLDKLNRVVDNRSDIYGYILVKSDSKRLYLTGGDGEVFITTSVELIEGITEFTVEFKVFYNAIKSLPSMPIDLIAEDGKLTCKYGNGKFQFPIGVADEFVKLDEVEGELIYIENENIVNLARSYVANDELRPVMNGVYFDFKNGYIVSSDGHKLFRGVFQKGEGAFICPPKALISLSQMHSYKVKFNEKSAVFEDLDTRLYTRLIEGRFPNYNSVIPQNNNVKVEVDKHQLIQALKRMEVASPEESSLVRLSFTNNSLTLSVEDIHFAKKAFETIECECSSPMDIGFKIPFLIEVLNGIEGDVAKAELADPSRASLWSGDNDNLFLLMPMMLND